MVLASVGMSWIGVRMQRARMQRAVVDAIEREGGCVEYDYEVDAPGSMKILGAQPPGPAWLRGLLGIDFFADVVSVDLCKGAGMRQLEGLPILQTLRLYSHEVTDSEMKYLEGLTQLQLFSLNSTLVTDGGLKHLKALPQLQELSLGSTPFTDAGLEHLRGLSMLRLLVLDRTKFTKDGVRKLQQALPNCKIHFSHATVVGLTQKATAGPLK
jgi:hypothetical protein